MSVEPDGLVRSYPFGEKLDGEFLPSMAAVLAGRYDKTGGAFQLDFGIAAESVAHLRDNVAAADLALPADALAELDAIGS